MEEWRDIIGYEGKYQISNFGRVKSFKRYKEGKILRAKNNKEYLSIGLSNGKDGKQKYYLIHRLVAEAFIPNPNNYPIINHIDENKKNNKATNLEWCTHKYNINYGTCIERAKIKMKENHADFSGEKHPMYGKHHTKEAREKMSKARMGIYIGSKNPRAQKVICMTTKEIFDTATEAANKMKTHENSIIACCRGKRKSSGKLEDGTKLVWRYYK